MKVLVFIALRITIWSLAGEITAALCFPTLEPTLNILSD